MRACARVHEREESRNPCGDPSLREAYIALTFHLGRQTLERESHPQSAVQVSPFLALLLLCSRCFRVGCCERCILLPFTLASRRRSRRNRRAIPCGVPCIVRARTRAEGLAILRGRGGIRGGGTAPRSCDRTRPHARDTYA